MLIDKHFGRLGNRLFQMAYIYAQMRKGEIPDVYLQDNKYFDAYRDEINQMFGEGIVPDDRIAIHVRRGDYVDNPFYVNLPDSDYYIKASKLFPNSRFLIFSDDIEWCKGYFAFWNREDSFDFSEGKTPEEDLRLMAGCKGIIMANSSLSWWGAYLGDLNKQVIYPRQWFSDKMKRVYCPKEWHAL